MTFCAVYFYKDGLPQVSTAGQCNVGGKKHETKRKKDQRQFQNVHEIYVSVR